MKILMVSTIVPKNRADWWRIKNIANLLKSNGHQLDHVHYCRKSAYDNIPNKEEYLDHKFVVFKSWFFAPINIHLKHLSLLKNRNYDLVYCNGPCSVFLSILGRIKRIPIVFDIHGDVVEEFKLKTGNNSGITHNLKLYFIKTMDYFSLKFSDKKICVSRQMIKNLNKKGYDNTYFVTNGVNLDFFSPISLELIDDLKKNLNIQNKFVVGYIGDFQKWQGLDNLIKAAKMIDNESIVFIFVGAKEYKRINNNLIFIPRVNINEIPKYYSICDIFVLPRPYHKATDVAAPTKFAEYAAMGKPILSTNVGDASKLVKKYKCGVVVDYNSPKKLIKGINQFINLSNQKLDIMGKNSRKLAEAEFDWYKIGETLSKIFNHG